MIGPIRQLLRAGREYDRLFGRGAFAREVRVVLSATCGFFVLSTLAAIMLGDAL